MLGFRENGDPLNPRLMLCGFESIVEWSRSYIEFNVGHSDSHAYIQKKQKDNEVFAEFIRVRNVIHFILFVCVFLSLSLFVSVTLFDGVFKGKSFIVFLAFCF